MPPSGEPLMAYDVVPHEGSRCDGLACERMVRAAENVESFSVGDINRAGRIFDRAGANYHRRCENHLQAISSSEGGRSQLYCDLVERLLQRQAGNYDG